MAEDGRSTDGPVRRGGIWCQGLCGSCNSLAGGNGDDDYCTLVRAIRRAHLVLPGLRGAPTASPFRPAGAARSMLYGCFGFAPKLRELYPEFAEDLLLKLPHEFDLPDDLILRLAATDDQQALVTGGVAVVGVLPPAQTTMYFASAFFRPLAWGLVPADEPGEAGAWLDVSAWTASSEQRMVSEMVPPRLLRVDVPHVGSHGWMFGSENAVMVRGQLGPIQ